METKEIDGGIQKVGIADTDDADNSAERCLHPGR